MADTKRPEYEDFEFSTIAEAIASEEEGEILRIVGFASEVKRAQHTIDAKGRKKLISFANIYDEEGDYIETTDISFRWYNRLTGLKKKKVPVELLARVVGETNSKNGNLDNKLDLIRFRSGAKPLIRLRASVDEIDTVEKYVKSRRKKGWKMFEEIREAIIEETGTFEYNKDKRYKDAITAIIAQGFSGGYIGKSSGKLHSFLVGAPATGKGYIWEIAKLINVTYEEGQARTTTKAGVAGAITKDKKYGVDPGIIVLANKGIFGIQDFNQCKDKSDILSILSNVMEEGKILVKGAGKAEYETEVSVYLDLNRQTELLLRRNKKIDVADDIKLPTNILSRMDFIIQLKDQDFEAYKEKGIGILEMHHSLSDNKSKSNRKSVLAKYCDKHDIPIGRFLKILVSYVMENFADIDTMPMIDIAKKNYGKIWKANEHIEFDSSEVKNCLGRLPNSIIKFIRAFTRLQLRHTANRESVDMAFSLIKRKLQFLRLIDNNFKTPIFDDVTSPCFAKWMVNKFGHKIFSPKQVIEKYRKEGSPCNEKKDRQLLNWISEVAKKDQQNKWRIKPGFLKAYGN